MIALRRTIEGAYLFKIFNAVDFRKAFDDIHRGKYRRFSMHIDFDYHCSVALTPPRSDILPDGVKERESERPRAL